MFGTALNNKLMQMHRKCPISNREAVTSTHNRSNYLLNHRLTSKAISGYLVSRETFERDRLFIMETRIRPDVSV